MIFVKFNMYANYFAAAFCSGVAIFLDVPAGKYLWATALVLLGFLNFLIAENIRRKLKELQK